MGGRSSMSKIRLHLPQIPRPPLISDQQRFLSGNRDIPVISAPWNEWLFGYIIKQHNKNRRSCYKRTVYDIISKSRTHRLFWRLRTCRNRDPNRRYNFRSSVSNPRLLAHMRDTYLNPDTSSLSTYTAKPTRCYQSLTLMTFKKP